MSFFRPIEVRGRMLGDGRVPAICVSLLAGNPQDLEDEFQSLLAARPDVVEWRADHFLAAASPRDVADLPDKSGLLGASNLPDAANLLAVAARLRELAGDVPLLFTLRSAREGGVAGGLDDAQAAIVQEAAARSAKFDLIDLELAALPRLRERVLPAARDSGTRIVLSAHDFSATPTAAEIFALLERAAASGADVAKVAVMPRTMGDVLALLAATERAHRELTLPVITMAMGPLGVLSRVFGGLFGSALSFAAGRTASAPGQLPISELRAAFELVRSRSLPR
jgi:3-dehydroquinate dehydratase-1